MDERFDSLERDQQANAERSEARLTALERRMEESSSLSSGLKTFAETMDRFGERLTSTGGAGGGRSAAARAFTPDRSIRPGKSCISDEHVRRRIWDSVDD